MFNRILINIFLYNIWNQVGMKKSQNILISNFSNWKNAIMSILIM